ncbi:MAG: alpha/beta hydrolase, partial [candidate division NC10 bacterium]|nr:alpha/beta hydrolase [candidate division NC10 bacterium]
MPNPVLIVHGWSDNYESFVPLKTWLASQGYPAQQVFLGNYESMEDHVTFDDLATGLHMRLEEMQEAKTIPELAPFSLDVIVHSTGGPVVRHWLHYYLNDNCKGDLARCPIRSLIMLAPANFGSRLAAQGKSALAKLFRGGVGHGFQTGRLILEGLELGSPALWGM